MTWTENRACVVDLPNVHKHTRALPAACCCYGVVGVLRLWFWCCNVLQLPMALASLLSLITCNEKTLKKNKVSKELREGSPTTIFLVSNYGLGRAERWDDMPSTSCEVGEI